MGIGWKKRSKKAAKDQKKYTCPFLLLKFLQTEETCLCLKKQKFPYLRNFEVVGTPLWVSKARRYDDL